VNPVTWAVSKSDLFMKDPTGRDADNLAYGSTLSVDLHAGRPFDYPIANPPYGKDWNRDEDAVRAGHDRGTAGRFAPGLPRITAFFRPSQLAEAGLTRNQLPALLRSRRVEHVARGLYRITDAEPTENDSLAMAFARVPNSVVCILTALRVHEIGTQPPVDVWLAIPHEARVPRLRELRLRTVRFSGPAWTFGVRDATFEGVPARITSPAQGDDRGAVARGRGPSVAATECGARRGGDVSPDAAASVRARLLNQARRTGEEFERTLSRCAAERWLYRLGASAPRRPAIAAFSRARASSRCGSPTPTERRATWTPWPRALRTTPRSRRS
jgi:hypothetical protein